MFFNLYFMTIFYNNEFFSFNKTLDRSHLGKTFILF